MSSFRVWLPLALLHVECSEAGSKDPGLVSVVSDFATFGTT